MKDPVDADVLSEPTEPTPDPNVIEWLRAHEPDIAVDPVIMPKGRKRTALERWFDAEVGRFHLPTLGRGNRIEMGGVR